MTIFAKLLWILVSNRDFKYVNHSDSILYIYARGFGDPGQSHISSKEQHIKHYQKVISKYEWHVGKDGVQAVPAAQPVHQHCATLYHD